METHHRIANSLQLVSTFLSLQEREIVDDAAKQALKAAAARVAAVAKVQRALLGVDDDTVGLRDFLGSLCGDMRVVTGLTISTTIDDVKVDSERAQHIAIAVSELVLNAGKHAYEEGDGSVSVTCKRSAGGFLLLTVADGGRGMPDGFDPAGARGVGMTILRTAARQLDGELTFPAGGNGATARLKFPLG